MEDVDGMSSIQPPLADLEAPIIFWQAYTIWHPAQADAKNAYFRKVIDLPEDVQRIYFAGACDNAFDLYVNGVKAGQANRWDIIAFCRLSLFARPGRNVIAIHGRAADPSGLLGGQIVVETTSGQMLAFPTDATWRVSDRDQPGWTDVDFDDSRWLIPALHDPFPCVGRWAERQPQPDQPDLEYAVVEVAPRAIHSFSPGGGTLDQPDAILADDGRVLTVAGGSQGERPEFIVDFGTQVVGYPVLQIAAMPRGAVLEISYGQSLRELLHSPSCGLQGVDLATFDPGDTGRWVNPVVKGFRFARFIVRRADQPVQIARLSVLMYCYSGPQVGRFQSSDTLLNRVWAMCSDSVRLCMQRNHYSDDIKRERTLWMGDMWPEARTNYYAFRDYDLLKHSLSQLAGSDQVHKFLDYQCWWGLTLADYYRFTGDSDYLRSQKGNLQDAVAYLEQFETPAGPWAGLLIRPSDKPDWCMNRRAGLTSMLQCLWVGLLTQGAWLQRILGDTARADEWEAKAQLVRQKTNELFWDDAVGAYADFFLDSKLSMHYPQDGNAFAIVFGVASPQQASRVSQFMVERLHSPVGSYTVWPDYSAGAPHNIKNFISPFMTEFEAQAHFLAGNARAGLEAIRLTWGNMLARGATTTWEGYDVDGDYPDDHVSLCHGWSGGAAWVLGWHVLGVQPVVPGFAEFNVCPDCDDIRELAGVVPTPWGEIAVRHLFRQGQFHYQGTLKFDGPATAFFHVPGSEARQATVAVNGTIVWQSGSATPAGKGYDADGEGGRVRLVFREPGLYCVACS